jgi:hypothetical protein
MREQEKYCGGCRLAQWFSTGVGKCPVACCIRPGGRACRGYKPKQVTRSAKRPQMDAALL